VAQPEEEQGEEGGGFPEEEPGGTPPGSGGDFDQVGEAEEEEGECGEEESVAVSGVEDGSDEQRECDDSPERGFEVIAEGVEVLWHWGAL